MNSPSRAPRVEIAIAVVERDGQFLIGLRPQGAPLAGYWEFPGGKIHSGESVNEAAVRECLEETGLQVRVLGRYPVADHDYSHAAVRLHFLECAVDSSSGQLPPRFRWVPATELANYTFPPANAPLIAQLIERFGAL